MIIFLDILGTRTTLNSFELALNRIYRKGVGGGGQIFFGTF